MTSVVPSGRFLKTPLPSLSMDTSVLQVDEDGTFQVIDTDPLGDSFFKGIGLLTTEERVSCSALFI